jgi:hypothetical protein
MSAVQEILKTKMCRDTASIVMEYLCGNQDYWKGEYKKNVVAELDQYFSLVPIECIINAMKGRKRILKMRRKSNNIKKHIGEILSFHPTHEIRFECQVEKITDTQKLVLRFPTGKKKYAKIIKQEDNSFIYFTHRGRRFVFSFYDQENYYSEPIKYWREKDFLNHYISPQYLTSIFRN